MRAAAAAVSLVLLASSLRGQEPQPTPQERIAALERENLALKREVEVFRNRLDTIYARLAGEKHSMTISFPSDPDPEHLRGIRLPPNPSKHDVRLYVASILQAAARHRDGYGADDAEIPLLEKVGPANADVLLEPLLYADGPVEEAYLLQALQSLVGEDHKKLILSSLPVARSLVSIVLARGWAEEAAPTLVAGLADRESWTYATLPPEWVEAVASLGRPETYESLKTYLYYGQNRYLTWKAIRDLPGIALDAYVDKLWLWAREREETWIRTNVASIAAHYGHTDALPVLFDDPEGWPQREAIEDVTPYRRATAQKGWRFEIHLGKPETEEERAKKWFDANRDRLVFDKTTGKWGVKEAASAGK